MIVGTPKEIKTHENRVALVPAGVLELSSAGHTVLIEKGAGTGSGISDEEFVKAGASIAATAEEVWKRADLIVKVKEPLPAEYKLCRSEQCVFTYFHFAASRELLDAMLSSGADCLAYETLEVDGKLPLLTPMSEVAGRMAVQEGAKYLEKPMGGRGVLLGGIPGVEPGYVLILGAGVVGTHAALMAAGLGANVYLLDVNLDRLRELAQFLPKNVTLLYSTPYTIREHLMQADLVIGAVLIPGAAAPKLVRRTDLKDMKPGAVIVDVAIDQGGCVETAKPTTHSEPIYSVEGVIHYGVANMPGAVARTSTYGLTNATIRYVKMLARDGAKKSVSQDRAVRTSANVLRGKITYDAVAKCFGLPFVAPENVFKH
ncbi:MAG: alanine dehydrogenase [Planctomycetes bacterium]|nr:alanine dehydrogenase [Planctomycetota bacterium]